MNMFSSLAVSYATDRVSANCREWILHDKNAVCHVICWQIVSFFCKFPEVLQRSLLHIVRIAGIVFSQIQWMLDSSQYRPTWPNARSAQCQRLDFEPRF